MKKFMKGCAIAALVMFVIGFVFATVASSIRGRTAIEDVVESVTGGRVHVGRYPFLNWGVRLGDQDIRVLDWGVRLGDWDTGVLDWVDDVDFLEDIDGIDDTIDGSILFNSHYNILNGNVERFGLGSDIRELDLEVGACSFTTEPSPDDGFYLEAKYAGKLQSYVEDGTLYIRSTASVRKWDDLNGCRIILYVPRNACFEEAAIAVGAGRLEFDSLCAKEVSLEVGAGQIIMGGLQAGELDVSVGMGQMELTEAVMGRLDAEIGMGELVAEGALNGNADVECAMGNVSLTLDGSLRDFNYELSKALGNVTLGNSSSSGFSSEKYINNGSGKTVNIDCAVGNVSVQFTD